MNYCNSTLSINTAFACFLLAIPFCITAFPRRYKLSPKRAEALLDKGIYLACLLAFVLYPILSARTLKLYLARHFGAYRVLEADWRLETEDIPFCQVSLWYPPLPTVTTSLSGPLCSRLSPTTHHTSCLRPSLDWPTR